MGFEGNFFPASDVSLGILFDLIDLGWTRFVNKRYQLSLPIGDETISPSFDLPEIHVGFQFGNDQIDPSRGNVLLR